mgnify:FL=1
MSNISCVSMHILNCIKRREIHKVDKSIHSTNTNTNVKSVPLFDASFISKENLIISHLTKYSVVIRFLFCVQKKK